MAKPPYSPVQEAQPSTGGTPYLQEQSSPSAFGGTIGAAESQLGGEEKQAGASLFQAAVQAQDFKNTNDAMNASMSFMNDASDQWAKFHTLEGQAANDALPQFKQGLDDLLQKHAQTLTSPAAQAQFMSLSRYRASGLIVGAGDYAGQQQKAGWIKTGDATIDQNAKTALMFQSNPKQVAVSEDNALAAAEGNALHLNLAPGSDASKQFIDNAMARFYRPLIEGIMLTPASQGGGAQIAAATFDRLRGRMSAETQDQVLRMLRPVLRDQEGTDIVGQAMRGQGSGGAPQWTGPKPSTDQIDRAIHGQESGGAANAPTSPAGAVGGAQIMPKTFEQYAKSGEDINNPKDNAVVRARIVTDLASKFDNDPARVAVGYFSGEGNVAPAGNPTPWKQDAADKTGKTTSSYVGDVLKRLGGTQQTTAGGEGMATPSGWKMPDWSAAEQNVLRQTAGDSELQGIALGKLAQTRQRIEMATRTERTDLTAKLGDWTKAAEAGLPISVPEDRIRAVFEPDQAQRIMTQLGVAQAAGQVFSGLKFASPEQLGAAVTDLTTGTGAISDTMKARLGKVTGGTVTTPGTAGQPGVTEAPEMFGMRTAIAAKAIQLIQARQEQLKQDPANYALSEPTVNAAAKTLDPKNPDTFGAYARAQLSIQDHLGVRPDAQHVLTLDQANTFAQQIMQPGGDAKGTLDKFQKEWGDSWTHVFGDMVTLGKLPAEYQGVIALPDPKDAALLSRALAEKAKTGKDWDELLGHPAGAPPIAQKIRNDIRTNPIVQDQLEPSWAASGATLPQITEMRGAIETLAYAKQFYENKSTAAADAVKAFTDQYHFVGKARIPADKFDTVMGNAGQMLSTMTPQSIAMPQGYRLEDTPEARRLNPMAPAASDYIANLQANPTWITSPKGDAMMLLDNAGKLVRTPKGDPFTVPFDAKPIQNAPAYNEVPPFVMNP